LPEVHKFIWKFSACTISNPSSIEKSLQYNMTAEDIIRKAKKPFEVKKENKVRKPSIGPWKAWLGASVSGRYGSGGAEVLGMVFDARSSAMDRFGVVFSDAGVTRG
jgi:hypothetical protein